MAGSSWFLKLVGSEMSLDSLDDVLLSQLQDLYSAEQQLIKALPKMAAAAASPQLRAAFEARAKETQGHKQRLEQAFKALGKDPESETCEAIQGLITEGEEVINKSGHPEVKDAALIAAGQRVEHYEIAGYGCARTFARRLGHTSVAALLQQTLDEESKTNEKLTQIAEAFVNPTAARA